MAKAQADGSPYEGKPHGPIDLPDKVTAITLDGKPFSASNVALRLDEHLDLELQWKGPLNPAIQRIDQDLKVTFEGGTTSEFLMTNHRYVMTGHEEFVAVAKISPVALKGRSKSSGEAVLINGPVLHPKTDLVLTYDNHKVEIVALGHFRSINVRAEHLPFGRMITHRIVVKSVNGKPLKADKLHEFLGRVCAFLGLVKGTRVGFGQVRNNAIGGFRSLGFNRADRLKSPVNWFHWKLAENLPRLFTSYMDMMQADDAKRGLGRAIAYYKASNLTRDDVIETAVIMSLAALEAFAAYQLVAAGGWTQQMVRNVSQAEQIRACTRLLGIAGDPVGDCEQLKKRLKPKQAEYDGFSLLSEFRNGVTHPKVFKYDADIYDAWDAAQWLFEMQLLTLLGYQGKYQDRRRRWPSWVGDLSTMPVRERS